MYSQLHGRHQHNEFDGQGHTHRQLMMECPSGTSARTRGQGRRASLRSPHCFPSADSGTPWPAGADDLPGLVKRQPLSFKVAGTLDRRGLPVSRPQRSSSGAHDHACPGSLGKWGAFELGEGGQDRRPRGRCEDHRALRPPTHCFPCGAWHPGRAQGSPAPSSAMNVQGGPAESNRRHRLPRIQRQVARHPWPIREGAGNGPLVDAAPTGGHTRHPRFQLLRSAAPRAGANSCRVTGPLLLAFVDPCKP